MFILTYQDLQKHLTDSPPTRKCVPIVDTHTVVDTAVHYVVGLEVRVPALETTGPRGPTQRAGRPHGERCFVTPKVGLKGSVPHQKKKE